MSSVWFSKCRSWIQSLIVCTNCETFPTDILGMVAFGFLLWEHCVKCFSPSSVTYYSFNKS
jgi:hypothetical protein